MSFSTHQLKLRLPYTLRGVSRPSNVARQMKAYRAGYPTTPIMSNFSRLLNASVRITFTKLQVKANFVFCWFNLFLSPRTQSKNVSVFCHTQLQWKVMERCRNSISKVWSVCLKIALIEKIFRKKKFADTFRCLC